MSFPETDELEDLTPVALKKHLLTLIRRLYENREAIADMDEELQMQLYSNIVDVLDDSDNSDAFGTEGWRHSFGS